MFYPLNRHILVARLEKVEDEQSSFYLPDDYEKPAEPYEAVTVVRIADDCKLDIDELDTLIVDSSMINTVELDGKKYPLVLENYVYGVLAETRENNTSH